MIFLREERTRMTKGLSLGLTNIRRAASTGLVMFQFLRILLLSKTV